MVLTQVLLLRHNSMMRGLPFDNESKHKQDKIMAACQPSTHRQTDAVCATKVHVDDIKMPLYVRSGHQFL